MYAPYGAGALIGPRAAFTRGDPFLAGIGWQQIREHDAALTRRLHAGLSSIPGVRLLGPARGADTLPIASFVIDGVAHPLVAARLSAEFGIGVRHGCFCAHPYLVRVLGLGPEELRRFRSAARRHDRSSLPGAVRASAGISTKPSDVERLLEAVELIASTPPPVTYACDPRSGDYWPEGMARPDAAPGPAEDRYTRAR